MTRTTRLLVLAATAGCLLVGGCTAGDAAPGAGGSASRHSSGAGGSSSPSAPPSSPSAPPSPSLSNADGPRFAVRNPVWAVHVPRGWKEQSRLSTSLAIAAPDNSAFFLFAQPIVVSRRPLGSIAEQGRQAYRTLVEDGDYESPRLHRPVTVNGVEMWHLSALDVGEPIDRYGVRLPSLDDVEIEFHWSDPDADRDGVTQEVLGGVEWLDGEAG